MVQTAAIRTMDQCLRCIRSLRCSNAGCWEPVKGRLRPNLCAPTSMTLPSPSIAAASAPETCSSCDSCNRPSSPQPFDRDHRLVNVGTDHDSCEFALASIRGWGRHQGRHLYPRSETLLITADGGGRNDWRLRLWKVELQKFADESGLSLSVCHFPPGKSKWNKIEHRLSSFITSNWRGEPFMDQETIVNLIAGTTTAKRPKGDLPAGSTKISHGPKSNY